MLKRKKVPNFVPEKRNETKSLTTKKRKEQKYGTTLLPLSGQP